MWSVAQYLKGRPYVLGLFGSDPTWSARAWEELSKVLSETLSH